MSDQHLINYFMESATTSSNDPKAASSSVMSMHTTLATTTCLEAAGLVESSETLQGCSIDYNNVCWCVFDEFPK